MKNETIIWPFRSANAAQNDAHARNKKTLGGKRCRKKRAAAAAAS